jgi:hypothetical protein
MTLWDPQVSLTSWNGVRAGELCIIAFQSTIFPYPFLVNVLSLVSAHGLEQISVRLRHESAPLSRCLDKKLNIRFQGIPPRNNSCQERYCMLPVDSARFTTEGHTDGLHIVLFSRTANSSPIKLFRNQALHLLLQCTSTDDHFGVNLCAIA